MSFSETVFLFVLALIVFGPKKLPEMARQAGKLLAELRRASNEFKSQIETEISHLETEKKKPTLTLSDPPPGTVASLSLNPASSQIAPHEAGATLAAPVAEGTPPPADGNGGENLTQSASAEPGTSSSPDPAADPAGAPTAQDSHV
jgi:sec-independent protein translocase protein TatB